MLNIKFYLLDLNNLQLIQSKKEYTSNQPNDVQSEICHS